jgi:hypothetical protein
MRMTVYRTTASQIIMGDASRRRCFVDIQNLNCTMGNSASAANSSSPGGEESPEVTSSGVFLADNLQRK